jgi:hypothetical protein
VNSRLDEIQAAVLRARLPHLKAWTTRRRKLAAQYRAGLGGTSIAVPPECDARHVYHLFVVRVPDRDRLQGQLAADGIETLVHYPTPIPRQQAFATTAPADCPIAARACAEVLSLPLHPGLNDARCRQRDCSGERTRRMHALITGGAGFIGSHLAEALLANGDSVFILDNLSTGAMENIVHLKGRAGFDYFIDSVENEGLLAELVDRSDVVFHLAAAVGVKLIVEQPVRTIETNVHGTEIAEARQQEEEAGRDRVDVRGSTARARIYLPRGLDPSWGRHRIGGHACSKAIDEFLALAY